MIECLGYGTNGNFITSDIFMWLYNGGRKNYKLYKGRGSCKRDAGEDWKQELLDHVLNDYL